jgi:plastocyanin
MNKTLTIGVIALVLLGGGGLAYVKLSKSMSPQNTVKEEMTEPPKEALKEMTVTPEPSAASVQGAETSQDNTVKTFTIAGGNYYFKPNEMKVKKGDTVKITFTNDGGVHDFVIDEFNVRSKGLKSGESTDVQFVADRTGTFEFYCSVGKHRQMGMKGNLIVE